ncbi:unnamed protein product [Ceutorhynchus assimilis]|uniref:Protein takeout n=1 Tax=Ceutorhynchus assimilis TaxID=467358 RepID=A0A9N9MR66_9CUCU|nr:unnamed protein product [Ceutorhynchus assimilis]
MMRVIKVVSLNILLSALVLGKTQLPTFLKICHKSDTHFKQCLIDSIEALKPLMSKGIPEFGIPKCEPLRIAEVQVDLGNGPVSVKSNYRDIKVYGPSDFSIKNIKVDLDKDRLKIKLYIPRLEVNTNYTMNGKILMMPVTGTGLSFGNYTNIDATMSMAAKKIKRDGEVFYNIQECYIDFNIGHAKLRFENMFNGNTELGDAINLFLNDNWKTVASEIKPVLEEKIAEIFKKFANKIFHKYPISMLFPE